MAFRLWRTWQDLPQQRVDILARLLDIIPLSRIPQAALFKSHAVPPVRPPDVQMARDDHLGVIPLVPVLGLLGPTPQRESGRLRYPDQVFPQGPVIDDDQGHAPVEGRLELPPCFFKEDFTPRLT